MDEQKDTPAKADRGFQLNPPTMICLLYIAAYFTLISAVIGVVLAYVWRREDNAAWEDTHYTYLIRTFWMAVLGCCAGLAAVVGLVLLGEQPGEHADGPIIVGIGAGVVLLLALVVLLVVRCALALVNAQKNRPMPRPRTWLA